MVVLSVVRHSGRYYWLVRHMLPQLYCLKLGRFITCRIPGFALSHLINTHIQALCSELLRLVGDVGRRLAVSLDLVLLSETITIGPWHCLQPVGAYKLRQHRLSCNRRAVNSLTSDLPPDLITKMPIIINVAVGLVIPVTVNEISLDTLFIQYR